MAQPTFFKPSPGSTLADIAALTEAQLADPSRAGQQVRGLASLDEAGPMHLTFFDNLKYAGQLALTKAGACLVSQRFAADVPGHVAALRVSHQKVPRTGRVLIQNNVEIGAGTTVDRGSLRDTVVGEGTKIDNQVQIGHNVTIGRHCLLAAQIGLAGSLTIGNDVALGAKVDINNHLHIGDGAQVTAMSAVKDDIPANGRWGGHFAKPTKQWFREMIAVERLVRDSTIDSRREGREREE